MSTIDVLEQLEANSSRLAKEDILEANVHDELLLKTLKITLDPYIVFNVVKVKTKTLGSSLNDDEALEKFLNLLMTKLSTRELTGNAARDAVTDILHEMTAAQQKWCKRILLRNLRIGVLEKTVNKVWPNSIIPFACMLADKLDVKDGKLTTVLRYPVWIEPKLDGLRCIAIKSSGKCTLYTRNGNEIDTLPRIKSAIEASKLDNFVLDGEAIGKDWSETDSVIMSRKHAKDDADIVFNVFDAMSLEDWKSNLTNHFIARRTFASGQVSNIGNQSIKIVEHGSVVNNEQELLQKYHEHCALGYEGSMVKILAVPYSFGRSSVIMKLKPVATIEGVIKGHFEARVGTKREGLFGGFFVEVRDGVTTRVGSGMSDKLKAEIQLNGPETYIGRVVECKFQASVVTEDGLTEDGRMLFPRFVRFRDIKDVDVSRLPL